MANERLRDALARKGMTLAQLADYVGVDPKTPERWISRPERIPHRQHRLATAAVLEVDEEDLWPEVAHGPRVVAGGGSELVEFFGSRSTVPARLWDSLIGSACEHLDVLVMAGLFFPEHHDPARIAARARAGCRVRLLLADPAGAAVRLRGVEEGFGAGVAHRVTLALRYFEGLVGVPGIEVRLHDTTLYASLYRSDDTLLANVHVYGAPAAQNPVLHLRRVPGGRVVDHYLASWERVWSAARPVDDLGAVIASVGEARRRSTMNAG